MGPVLTNGTVETKAIGSHLKKIPFNSERWHITTTQVVGIEVKIGPFCNFIEHLLRSNSAEGLGWNFDSAVLL